VSESTLTLDELTSSDGLAFLVACYVNGEIATLAAWEPAGQWPQGHEVTRAIEGRVYGLVSSRWRADEAEALALAHQVIRAVYPRARPMPRFERSGYLTL
jgi:hypothetical protein